MSAVSSIIMGGSALLSGGLGVASFLSQGGAPDVGAAPTPANYYSYDADGNLAGSQVWDTSKNAYVYRAAPLTEQEKADKAKRSEIRSQMLSNLNMAPEDRVKAYEEYAVNFSKAAHKDVDEQYSKLVASTDENLSARGLMGSKAYADIVAENAKSKMDVDTDIATKSALAKEELANTDRTYWLNVLAALDSQANADTIANLQKTQVAMQGANQGTAGLLGAYNIQNNANYQNWLAKTTMNQSNMNTLTNTAGGLAYLYGYNKNRNPLSPSVSSSSSSGVSYPATGKYSFLNL